MLPRSSISDKDDVPHAEIGYRLGTTSVPKIGHYVSHHTVVFCMSLQTMCSLTVAAISGHTDVVKWLLECPGIDANPKRVRSPSLVAKCTIRLRVFRRRPYSLQYRIK